jgi:hypothetical protein
MSVHIFAVLLAITFIGGGALVAVVASKHAKRKMKK